MISDEGGVSVQYGELPRQSQRSGDLFGQGTKNETPPGSFDEEVEKARARGFTIEVDERAEPIDETNRLRQILTRYFDARSKFQALRKLLPTSKRPVEMLTLLLSLIAEIEADIEEHDTAFAAGDKGPQPDLSVPRAYRAQYELRLSELLEKK